MKRNRILTKVEKLIIFDGKFLNKAAEYPAYNPPTPSVRTVCRKTSSADPTIPTCIRCLITSFGTSIAEEVIFPIAAATGGMRVLGQFPIEVRMPFPSS